MKKFEALSQPIFTAGEAREFLGLPLPRFQDYLARDIFKFDVLEQGDRRIVRRFSAWGLMHALTATILMTEHSISPAAASVIAYDEAFQIALQVVAPGADESQAVNILVQEVDPREESDLALKTAVAARAWYNETIDDLSVPDFVAICGGRILRFGASKTLGEVAKIFEANSFVAVDTSELKRRVGFAMVRKLEQKIRTEPEAAGGAEPAEIPQP